MRALVTWIMTSGVSWVRMPLISQWSGKASTGVECSHFRSLRWQNSYTAFHIADGLINIIVASIASKGPRSDLTWHVSYWTCYLYIWLQAFWSYIPTQTEINTNFSLLWTCYHLIWCCQIDRYYIFEGFHFVKMNSSSVDNFSYNPAVSLYVACNQLHLSFCVILKYLLVFVSA